MPRANFYTSPGTFPTTPVRDGARHRLPDMGQRHVTQMPLENGNGIQIQTRCPSEKLQWACGSWIPPTPGGCLLLFLSSRAHKPTSSSSCIQSTAIVLCGDHLMGIGGPKRCVVAPQHPRKPTEHPQAFCLIPGALAVMLGGQTGLFHVIS